jgi:hypothetical protein
MAQGTSDYQLLFCAWPCIKPLLLGVIGNFELSFETDIAFLWVQELRPREVKIFVIH